MTDFGAHPQARPGAGRRVLVTGAAGRIGRAACPGLAARGWRVRGLDRRPLDGVAGLADPPVVAEIGDRAALDRATAGVDAVVHLAGVAGEAAFPEILEANIDGTYQVFEAGRRSGVPRIVYASSNHAVGFTPRCDLAGVDLPPRPDTYYGLSKVFGEALGRLYVDRYRLEVVCLRIGSWEDRPKTPRHLATWLSPADGVRLLHAALSAPDVGFTVVYGISANTRAWWDLAPARALGYLSVDDAEDYAEEILAEHGEPDPADPEHAYLGGDFTGPEYDFPIPAAAAGAGPRPDAADSLPGAATGDPGTGTGTGSTRRPEAAGAGRPGSGAPGAGDPGGEPAGRAGEAPGAAGTSR
jgi:uronate dehydrogenase